MKKITIIVFAALLICFGAACFLTRHENAAPANAPSAKTLRIVIDPGHGEPDGGATGSTLGLREEDLNLQIAEKLKTLLTDEGYDVIMTRKTNDQIGSSKNADMAERRRIIRESGQDLTVSIHQNFYQGDASVRGPQVFYAPGSEQGRAFAAAIQNALNTELAPPSPRTEHEGDYYIVKSGDAPAVIVECGFLSNPEEEALLLRSQYQVRIAKAIFSGIQHYLTVSAAAE